MAAGASILADTFRYNCKKRNIIMATSLTNISRIQKDNMLATRLFSRNSRGGDEITKEAGIITEGLMGMAGGHIAQNALPIASSILKPGAFGNFIGRNIGPASASRHMVRGAVNALSPETGIIREHVGELVHGFNDATKGERAAALALLDGKIDKVLSSKTFQKSGKLQNLLSSILGREGRTLSKVEQEVMYRAIREHGGKPFALMDRVHSRTRAGKEMEGLARGLKSVNPATAAEKSVIEPISEVAANAAISQVEPWIVPINIVKRGLANKQLTGINEKVEKAVDVSNNVLVHNGVAGAVGAGTRGEKISNLRNIAETVVANPVTAGVKRYANLEALAYQRSIKKLIKTLEQKDPKAAELLKKQFYGFLEDVHNINTGKATRADGLLEDLQNSKYLETFNGKGVNLDSQLQAARNLTDASYRMMGTGKISQEAQNIINGYTSKYSGALDRTANIGNKTINKTLASASRNSGEMEKAIGGYVAPYTGAIKGYASDTGKTIDGLNNNYKYISNIQEHMDPHAVASVVREKVSSKIADSGKLSGMGGYVAKRAVNRAGDALDTKIIGGVKNIIGKGQSYLDRGKNLTEAGKKIGIAGDQLENGSLVTSYLNNNGERIAGKAKEFLGLPGKKIKDLGEYATNAMKNSEAQVENMRGKIKGAEGMINKVDEFAKKPSDGIRGLFQNITSSRIKQAKKKVYDFFNSNSPYSKEAKKTAEFYRNPSLS